MTDSNFLHSMGIEPWEDAPPAPQQQLGTEDRTEFFHVPLCVDEDGVAHLMWSDLERVQRANHSLRAAADNWCRQAQEAQRRVKYLSYAVTVAVALIGILVFVVVK